MSWINKIGKVEKITEYTYNCISSTGQLQMLLATHALLNREPCGWLWHFQNPQENAISLIISYVQKSGNTFRKTTSILSS